MSVCFYYPYAIFGEIYDWDNIFKHSCLRNKHLSFPLKKN